MKLKECSLCSLCKKRDRISFSKGQKPASVLILFDKEPVGVTNQEKLRDFIRRLNYHLKFDYYYSFLVKCYSGKGVKIKSENIKACRRWFKEELKKVDPYLVIMMGKMSAAACLGGKILPLLQEGVFYVKANSEGEKIQFYKGCDIENSNKDRIEKNIARLESFIKEFYNGTKK